LDKIELRQKGFVAEAKEKLEKNSPAKTKTQQKGKREDSGF